MDQTQFIIKNDDDYPKKKNHWSGAIPLHKDFTLHLLLQEWKYFVICIYSNKDMRKFVIGTGLKKYTILIKKINNKNQGNSSLQ